MATKQSYDMALSRLIIIIQKLYEGESVSVSGLAEEFGVSTKTIQRDLNERLHMIPLKKEGQKWRLEDGYSIQKARSIEDKITLDAMTLVAHSVGEEFGRRAHALISKIKNDDESHFYSKKILEDLSADYELIQSIQMAISGNLAVSFGYGQKYKTVKPYKIVNFDGYWYLYAEDVLEDKFKTFYIKSIHSFRLETGNFEQNTDALNRLEKALNVWFEPNSELFEIRLLVRPAIAKYFERRPISTTQKIITTRPNGDVEMSVLVSSEKEALYEIKKWIPDIAVISPKSLALQMKNISTEFLNNQLNALLS
jgi:predicted DNA-binding transcriptional regulator YafY